MCHDVVLRAEHRYHPIARVVVPQVHRDGPLQHRPDALAHGAGCLRLGAPDRREDLQHVGRVDFGDGPAADARYRHSVPCSASSSARATGRASRRASVRGRARRPRRTWERPPRGASPRGDRRPDCASMRLARASSQALASGTERGGAEPEFAALAVDDEPLDPDCGSGRRNEQVQAIAVGETPAVFGEVEPEFWRPVVQQRGRPLPSHRADVGCRLPCVDTPIVMSGRFRGGVSIACRLSAASALAAYRTGRAVIVASPSREECR